MKRNPVYKRLLRIEIVLILFLLFCILIVKSCFQPEPRERFQQMQQNTILTEPVALPDEPVPTSPSEDPSGSLDTSSDSVSSPGTFSIVGDAVGLASYYQDVFDGHPMASGEPYDLTEYTAAHRELSFGTEVRVTNMANGKNVTVRINDRGPNTPERIIDLSGQAARAIGLFEAGVARVRLEVLN